MSALKLDNYRFILETPNMYKGFLTSFGLTVVAILIGIIVSVWVMYYKQRHDKTATLPVELGAALTYSTPASMLALSMIFIGAKYRTSTGRCGSLLIAYVTRYILLLLRGSNTALLGVTIELEEAASVFWIENFREMAPAIIIPIIKNQIFRAPSSSSLAHSPS